MAFEQAAIKVQKEHEFATLQAAVERAFQPETIERFLKKMDRKGIRIRDLETVLAKGLLETVGESGPGESRVEARQLYDSLPVSDQALLREFYLSKLESVETALRHRFKKLYQYY